MTAISGCAAGVRGPLLARSVKTGVNQTRIMERALQPDRGPKDRHEAERLSRDRGVRRLLPSVPVGEPGRRPR